jgi:hypothetical protein
MRIAETAPLFAWEALRDSPSLCTLRELLGSVPDGPLLAALRRHRCRGRDDYPVQCLWGVVLLTIALRHPTIEATLAELSRNEGLRRLIGIGSEEKVPKKWNLSRFLVVLGEEPHRELMDEAFGQMVCTLGGAVPDLGKETAGDASGLSARATARESAGRGTGTLPLPGAGRKEYADEQGQVTQVIEWYGYKFHVLVDKRHEVVVSWMMTGPQEADNEVLPQLLTAAQGVLPKGRIKTLAYDKACDDGAVHELLQEQGIAAIIENRSLWQHEHERLLPGADGRSNVVYDEAGTLYCYDKDSAPPVRHRMAYIGHEPSRGTLKYRCPARHEHWACPSDARCNGLLCYGRTVRVKREIDLRRFPAVPRATKKFQRLYKGRTAVQRVIGRLKVFWGADDGNVTGARRFRAWLGAVMIVHVAMATLLAAAPRRKGTLGKMRLGPIARASREKLPL